MATRPTALTAAKSDAWLDNGGHHGPQLRKLLEATTGEAVPTFLSVLEEPGSIVEVVSEDDATPTAQLLTIYRRRAEHVQRIGLPTLGFDEAVKELQVTSHQRLAIALAQAKGGHPHCVAFLAEDLSVVVATLAVLAPRPGIERNVKHPETDPRTAA